MRRDVINREIARSGIVPVLGTFARTLSSRDLLAYGVGLRLMRP